MSPEPRRISAILAIDTVGNFESIEAVSASNIPRSTVASRFETRLRRYQNLFLGFVIAVTLFDLAAIALHSPLGTDELMARVSAQSPTFWRMLTLLRDQPVNVDPPAFPVLGYLAARLPLPIDFAIRVPAMIAMCVALLALFFLVRDQLGAGSAYVAVGLLATNEYILYGAKARPYALLLAATIATILCWQRAIQGGPKRRLWLMGLSFTFALALLSHYFAVFPLLAVMGGELARCFDRRKIDWPVWGALGAAALLCAPVYLLLAPAGRPYRAHPFDKLYLPDLNDTYRDTLNFHFLFVILVVSLCLAVVWKRPKAHQSLSAYNWIAAVCLILGPVLLFGAGELYTHTYALRYGICAVAGVAIAVAAFMNFVAGGSARILVPAFALAFAIYQVHLIRIVRYAVYSPSAPWIGATPELLRQYSDLPLVIPHFDYWMRTKFYGPSWLSSPLIMVTNRESMQKLGWSENLALAALAIHRWTGWPLADYYAFTRDHKRFLMYDQFWMRYALEADGAKIEPLGYIGPYRLHLVTLPPIPNKK